MQSQFYTTLLLAFAIQLDYFILHADAEGQLQKPEIHGHISAENVDLVCQMELLPSGTNISCNLYIGDSSEPFLSTWTKSQPVCNFVVKPDDLQQGLQSVAEVSCDYSVPTDPRSPSPRSDKIKIEDKKTTSPPHVTTKKKKKKPPTSPPVMTKKTSTAHSTTTFNTTASLQSTLAARSTVTAASRTSHHSTRLKTPAGIGVILTVIVILLGMTGACLYWIHRKRKSSGLPTTPNDDTVYTTVDVSKGAGSSDAMSPFDVTYSTVTYHASQMVAFQAQQDNIVYNSLNTD
ncbi:uncharacterized protein LOC135256916 isoform X2 [Anguilla rostrata]|uniref:uncharacterized protein LOC135256916 isoform X2 n=1 Tax=Anguilla rostrata TaxID=7938 RepID=UPI0030CA835C